MIYQNFKKKLLNDLEKEKDMMIISEKSNHSNSLFCIENVNDRLYKTIIKRFEIIACQNVENLVIDLCKEKGIKCNISMSNLDYYDIEVIINGTRMLIDFKSGAVGSAQARMIVKHAERVNDLYVIVFLLKDRIESRRYVDDYKRKLINNDVTNIKCLLFEDFLAKIFGSEEKNKFQKEMINFGSEMHKAIGYQITELCSPYNLEKLKKELKDGLCSFDYNRLKKQQYVCLANADKTNINLNEKSFNLIKNTFISEKRYELLLGESDFAKSFVTSEWLYKKYFSLDELDNTFIVAGFLKSIEQLMWRIIFLVGQGREIKGIFINEDNQGEIDKTLGSLQHFLSNWANDDLYLNSFGNCKHFVMNYIKNQISNWRKQYRNGYFHKHNLEDKDKIESIRNETYFIYFLILGSLYLKPEQLSFLER